MQQTLDTLTFMTRTRPDVPARIYDDDAPEPPDVHEARAPRSAAEEVARSRRWPHVNTLWADFV